MGMAELVGRKSTAHPGGRGGVSQLSADSGRSASPAACWTPEHAEQRSDREGRADLEPWVEVPPSPAIHPNLALAAFAAAHEHCAISPVKIDLGQRERLADPGARRARAR